MTRTKVGSIQDFPEGEGTPVTVQGTSVAVFNLGDELKAIVDNCPHKNFPLHQAGTEQLGATLGAVDDEECSVQCPWHNLEFDLESGHNPVIDVDVPTFDVEVTDEGDVFIEH